MSGDIMETVLQIPDKKNENRKTKRGAFFVIPPPLIHKLIKKL